MNDVKETGQNEVKEEREEEAEKQEKSYKEWAACRGKGSREL